MMNKYYLDLMINEVKNFKKLQKQCGYNDLDELIGHYIEEGVITSRDDLEEALNILKKKLEVVVREETFNNWWVGYEERSK